MCQVLLYAFYMLTQFTITYEVGTIVVPNLQMRNERHHQEQRSQALDPGHPAAEPAFVISALSFTEDAYGEFGVGETVQVFHSQTGPQGCL